MRKFVFITNEGTCEDPQGFPVENSQVLGYAGGEDAEDALKKLIEEYNDFKDSGYDEVFAFELASENHDVFRLSEATQKKGKV